VNARRVARLRACLLAAAAAATGLAACAHAQPAPERGAAPPAGAAPVAPVASATAPAALDLRPSGDIELDQLRHLAVAAPLEALFAHAPMFLSTRVSTYPRDAILWRGVARMTAALVEDAARDVPVGVIGLIVTQIGGTARPDAPSLREHLPVLRERLAAARRRG
jgi:hypothetical protein